MSNTIMPYKYQKLYLRTWIDRKFQPRIDLLKKKTGKKVITIVNEAVDNYLKQQDC